MNRTIVTPTAFAGPVTVPTVSLGDTSSSAAPASMVTAAAAAVSPGRLLGVRVFTLANTGTAYTPTAGTTAIIVEACGGGGAGGWSTATAAGQYSIASSGGGGSYAKAYLTSGFSGVTLTIGAGGTVAASSGVNGTAGGTTSLGALISCPGGGFGPWQGVIAFSGNWVQYSGGSGGGAPTGGNILSLPGVSADLSTLAGNLGKVGKSGANPLGLPVGENYAGQIAGVSATVAANGYGVGGTGGFSGPTGVALAGGAGSPGVIIIYEYA
jgi:hypothetical protein